MKVREYLSHLSESQDVTFVIAKAREDERTPFFHPEYRTTPIRLVRDWKNEELLGSIILNDRQMPIDWLSGAPWKTWTESGHMKCLLVISEDDLAQLYPDRQQCEEMERFIDWQIKSRAW